MNPIVSEWRPSKDFEQFCDEMIYTILSYAYEWFDAKRLNTRSIQDCY